MLRPRQLHDDRLPRRRTHRHAGSSPAPFGIDGEAIASNSAPGDPDGDLAISRCRRPEALVRSHLGSRLGPRARLRVRLRVGVRVGVRLGLRPLCSRSRPEVPKALRLCLDLRLDLASSPRHCCPRLRLRVQPPLGACMGPRLGFGLQLGCCLASGDELLCGTAAREGAHRLWRLSLPEGGRPCTGIRVVTHRTALSCVSLPCCPRRRPRRIAMTSSGCSRRPRRHPCCRTRRPPGAKAAGAAAVATVPAEAVAIVAKSTNPPAGSTKAVTVKAVLAAKAITAAEAVLAKGVEAAVAAKGTAATMAAKVTAAEAVATIPRGTYVARVPHCAGGESSAASEEARRRPPWAWHLALRLPPGHD
mmetsp:Transcript_25750/g.65467  ORF Transcript_25750/g.65467 Transcript_25750/m.65467 type:complete len:361 (-) Transcript_25750:341-1423(-)